jgi:hypothetical protein
MVVIGIIIIRLIPLAIPKGHLSVASAGSERLIGGMAGETINGVHVTSRIVGGRVAVALKSVRAEGILLKADSSGST